MMYLCEEEDLARLPDIVKPRHYDIALTPNFSKMEFEGEVIIHIEVLRRTKEILLHSSSLEIDNIRLFNANNGIAVEPAKIEFLKKDEILKMHFENPVTFGNYRLRIKYEGAIVEETKGFFVSRYMNIKDELQVAAFTHFEPAYARRCFPCWDEPCFKATFKMTVTVPREYSAISNMAVEYIENVSKAKKYHFLTTPVMPTYLVALSIGQFEGIEAATPDGVKVRINVTNRNAEEGRFALEVAVKALTFYKKYFKTDYPLSKLDFVVLPHYHSDAMENWGLMVFREVNLLLDPNNSTNLTKRWIASMVCHEVAHQWFGNLVTIEWWSQLWLQEAIAQFAENLCVDYTFPNFDVWQHFVLEFRQTALVLDDSNITHPIQMQIRSSKQFDQIIDGICYNKGSAIIRMLYFYVGEEDFRKAIWAYMTAHSYKTASPENFYFALEEVSKKPIMKMMETWTKQTGFPVVKVFMSPGCDCKPNQEGITVKLVQTKFANTTSKGKPESEMAIWKIPITIITASNPEEEITLFMESREMKVFIPNVKADDWIVLNHGAIGYYRVQYSPDLLKKLGNAIKNNLIHVIDKITILEDLFYLVKYGYTSTNELLKLLMTFEGETEFLVWSTISRIMSKMAILVSNASFAGEFTKFHKKLLASVSTTLGWDRKPEDKKFDHLLRKLVLGQMSWFEDDKMIQEAKKRFQNEMALSETLPEDMKMACYRTVVRAGGEDEIDALIRMYETVDTYEERKSICCALSSAKDEKLLKKVLTFALSSNVRNEDTVLIILSITTTKTGRDLLWDYYRHHWRDIIDRVKNRETLAEMVRNITEKYASEGMAMELETFFNKQLPCNEATFRDALETLRNNAEWLERDSEEVQQFLSLK